MIQKISRFNRVFNNGEKHGIISEKLNIGSNISFKIINAYVRNNKGPRIEPWGTPDSIVE